ncbi:MAG: GNAT family N-acetyltransferase [Rhodoferax sp.]|nr:GNAT family N-acetyltransferase [Rhodoferax sp.]
MTLHIRPAQADDAQAISQLLQGQAHHFLLDPSQAATSPFLQTVSPAAITGYIASDFFDYCVGEIHGQLVGVVAVRDGSHLFHLFVGTAFQRRGYAAYLWAHARQAAIAKGNTEGFTVNSTPFALPVYQRFGFVATGPEVQTRGIAYVPMRLAIE